MPPADLAAARAATRAHAYDQETERAARPAAPRLVLPAGLQLPDAVLYLPDGSEHVVRERVEIPAELCHLDVDSHGIAVPFVAAGGDVANDRQRRRCIIDGLCGVCGFDLDYWKVWHIAAATEDDARATRVAYVPPVHPQACSGYAAAAYPSADDLPLWGYYARSYEPRLTTKGQLVQRLAPARRLERL